MIREAIQDLIDGKDLTDSLASRSREEIMAGAASPSQLGAFLASLRIKGETVGEIVALAKIMKQFSIKINPITGGRVIDIVGTGGDQLKTINLSTIASVLVATSGITVAKHGNRAASGKCGSTDVLEHLGYRMDATPEEVERTINRVGIGFMHAPVFHPAMKNVTGTRKEIGFRTIFNLLGPLTNPASADSLVVGVPSLDLTSKIALVLKSLGIRNAMIVYGEQGIDEISTFGKTFVSYLRTDRVEQEVIFPKDMGLSRASPESLLGRGVEENARAMFTILSNRLTYDHPHVEATLANAAGGLVVAERATNLEEGVQIARETLNTGRCIEKLKEMILEIEGDISKIEEFERNE
jgi:anthranilate phosphoribosyltransferase